MVLATLDATGSGPVALLRESKAAPELRNRWHELAGEVEADGRADLVPRVARLADGQAAATADIHIEQVVLAQLLHQLDATGERTLRADPHVVRPHAEGQVIAGPDAVGRSRNGEGAAARQADQHLVRADSGDLGIR